MKKLFRLLTILIVLCGLHVIPAAAESELVASLETLSGQVTLRRANTADDVRIRRESVVGVGDVVRTGADSTARITFFANGTDTEVLPNTEFRIDEFTGDNDRFNLTVTVLVGQTRQRINKLLDNGSSYTINSQGLAMAVRGTVFKVRVEPGGRAATIVEEGAVQTTAKVSGDSAPVPVGFGVRSEPTGLSDVVKATTFEGLDAALDGCLSVISTLGDVRLNVRTGPGLDFPRIGALNNNTTQRLFGRTASGWYRVKFSGGYGWIFVPAVKVAASCAGIREYPDDTPAEDTSSYTGSIATPEVTATVVP